MSAKDPKDGTPIDEAIRRMAGPCNPDIARSLHAAAEAFGEDDSGPRMSDGEILDRIGLVPGRQMGEDATDELAGTLEWMITDLDYRRAGTGMDPAPTSPQMQLAHRLLAELRAGRIECRRVG